MKYLQYLQYDRWV